MFKKQNKQYPDSQNKKLTKYIILKTQTSDINCTNPEHKNQNSKQPRKIN